jgi:hypothetical protein
MGLLGLTIALEMWPMITFVRQRIDLSKGRTPDTSHTRLLTRINDAELVLTVGVAVCAAAMARALF